MSDVWWNRTRASEGGWAVTSCILAPFNILSCCSFPLRRDTAAALTAKRQKKKEVKGRCGVEAM